MKVRTSYQTWVATPGQRLFRAAAMTVAAAASLAGYAGELNEDFSTDPTSRLSIGGNNPDYWVPAGGNTGGFLAITYPIGSQKTTAVFPDTDPGKVVTAFEFSCDLRVGNPTGDRAADGFSISLARAGDSIITDPNSDDFGGNCCAETGTKTGIAISFDTWSGNTFPNDPNDKSDIEGIIVRVDDVTVKKVSLPTRNGASGDITSLQTGPRDAAYWAASGDPKDPASWAGLGWQPFSIKLTEDGKLTVKWKNNTVLDNFQTAYFPTAGRLVFSGRTGGANEHTHVDNIKLKTTAASCVAPPSVPGNFKVAQAGARRAALTWDASTVAGDAGARIGYELERDGVALPGNLTATSYEAGGLEPGKTYTFKVRAKNVCGDTSAFASVTVTTVAEVDNIGFLPAQVYRLASDGTAFTGAGQAGIDTVLGDSNFPNKPDNVYYVNGFQFGEPGFGDTYGENHMVRIAGVFTAPKTGSARFYVRSDDASRLYVKAGTAIPDPNVETPIAREDGCCGGFEPPGAGDNGDGTFPTSDPMSLTAGAKYGITFLVKEGGGGDWGQVAIKYDDESSPSVIHGATVTGGKGDPVGAVVNITTQPASTSVPAFRSATFSVKADTSSPYGKPAWYQWYKNNTLVAGATAATWTIPVVQPGDNNAKIKVAIGVIGKSIESADATLTVTGDEAPKIAKVDGSDSLANITVWYDQPVSATTAAVAANYALNKGLTISGAAVVDQFTVRLTTSAQAPGTQYTLTVNNVQNLGGKIIAANSTALVTAWDLVKGRVRADQFFGTGGASLDNMDTAVNDAKYPNSPDVVRFLENGLTFGEPNFGDTWGENHLVAMRGILKPTKTAKYNFFVRSDDASRLFINTSGAAIPDAKTATAIATESGCCAGFQEPGDPRTSDLISLTAGSSYGVLYLVKEGGGGDWGQVAYREEGNTTPAGSLTPIKDAIYWYGPAAVVVAPTVSTIALKGANVEITYTGTLQSASSVLGPFSDVAGAISPYSIPASAAQLYFRSH